LQHLQKDGYSLAVRSVRREELLLTPQLLLTGRQNGREVKPGNRIEE
jgi:hypothetical protein